MRPPSTSIGLYRLFRRRRPWAKAICVALAAAGGLALAPDVPAAKPAADPREATLGAMQEEMQRAVKDLRLPGEDGPYFIRYLLRDHHDQSLAARFGGLVSDDTHNVRQANVEVRVGDYAFDNTADEGADGGFDMDAYERFQPPWEGPLENDLDALRGTFWLLTDAQYKNALAALHKKRGKRVTNVVEDDKLPSFAHAPPATAIDTPLDPAFDRPRWRTIAKEASARFKRHPEIFDGTVRISATHQVRTIVTSEGTALINEHLIYALHIEASSRAKDGVLIDHGKSIYGARQDELPDALALNKLVDRVAQETLALRKAPVLEPFNGPAIFLPEAAGVFFHEALGHRLEGERQDANHEGATFKEKLGKAVLPTFISVFDDPTLRNLGSISLNGHYGFDDEGVPSRPVTLVEKGVLRNFLMSRKPVTGALISNGHGRSGGVADPIGRMANTIVRSSRRVSMADLKRQLLAEVRKQKKEFGLIIADISGGQTNTSTYDFQAFKGEPRILYRVDGKTGKETLVRGVEFVGTPIGSLNRIVASSKDYGVFNGYCGAESGFIPVSTVAPALLIREIELQRSRRAMERPPVLPAPWKVDKQ